MTSTLSKKMIAEKKNDPYLFPAQEAIWLDSKRKREKEAAQIRKQIVLYY